MKGLCFFMLLILLGCSDPTTDYQGQVLVWQDGQLIFEKEAIRTMFVPGETADWGIGNYTDYINGGEGKGRATVYFDDAMVSSVRIGEFLDR